jgi:hypothetical protein
VEAAAAAGRAELADRAAFGVRRQDREGVGGEGGTAVVAVRGNGKRKGGDEDGDGGRERGAAAQWCSMTRSTRLYSLASSALMK